MMHTVVRQLVLLGTATALGSATLAAQQPTIPPHAPDSAAASHATAMQPAPAPVTVGGVVYAQYVYQVHDTAGHLNNFDVARAYVNVVGKFKGGLGTRVTSDIFRTADGSLSLRLKYAYFGYTPNAGPLTYKLGLIHTPLLDWEETLWDYRMQGPVALDRNGYLTSSDLGAGVDGSWSKDAINAQVGIYNGEGYSKAPGDKRKDVEGRVSARLLNTDDMSRVGGLRITGFTQIGKPTGGGIRDRFVGLVSYRSSLVTLAGEYARTKDRADNPPAPATPTGLTADGQVISVFGVFHIPSSRASLIGRVDVVDPNTDLADNRVTRFIAGAAYQLTPNLRLLADVDNLAYEGGTPTPALYATKTQALLQAQFTF
jgi:hypothetical protein